MRNIQQKSISDQDSMRLIGAAYDKPRVLSFEEMNLNKTQTYSRANISFMKKLILFTFFFISVVQFAAWARPINDNKADAIGLTELSYWTSPVEAFNNAGATNDGPVPSIYTTLGNNVWFKFQAQTTGIQIELNLGTMTSNSYILGLFDANDNEVDASRFNLGKILSSNQLVVGEWYYLSVSGAYGTFGLSINDQIGNDFKKDALDITFTSNRWDSGDEAFDTYYSTNDGPAPSVYTTLSRNIWFRFQANASAVRIRIRRGTMGNSHVMALFDENLEEQAAVRFNHGFEMTADDLQVGDWYYLSVGSGRIADIPTATFGLEIEYGKVKDSDEIHALRDLFESTDGSNWTNNSGWPVSTAEWDSLSSLDQIMNWHGLTIENGDVTRLEFRNNSLTGALPQSLNDLHGLQWLTLGGNNLSGELPSMEALTQLEHIAADYNNLTGPLPSGMANWTKLRQVYLYNNKLSGTIPSEIVGLPSLRFFGVQNNLLTSFPDFNTHHAPSLIQVNVFNNYIPEEDINANIIGGEPIFQSFNYDPQYIYNKATDALEIQALRDLYESTNGANWTNSEGWPVSDAEWDAIVSTNQLAGFYGIEVEGEDVITVDLALNNLTGELPTGINNLLGLKRLALRNNNLSGTLPGMEELVELEHISAQYNDLTGSLPTGMVNWAKLTQVYLDNNQLSGIVPEGITNLDKLSVLSIQNNSFVNFPDFNTHSNSGRIVVNISNNYISQSDIDANMPDGAHIFQSFTHSPQKVVPTDQGQVLDLAEITALLDLYQNTDGTNWTNSTGWPTTSTEWNVIRSIDQIADWQGITVENGDITKISLSANMLDGVLPASIVQLISLKELELGGNLLMGTIPENLSNLSQLTILDFSSNLLDGEIPSSIGSLNELVSLYLDDNLLSGSIPAEIGNLSSLQYLYLYSNSLSGNIPLSIGQLSNLLDLRLQSNQLIGSIPAELFDLTELRTLRLSANHLDGEISSDLGQLLNLNHLVLTNNQLTGSLPTEIGDLVNLRNIDIGYNNLSGQLPESIGNLDQLEFLMIRNNQFEGKMSDTLISLSKLHWIYAHDNKFTSIPDFSNHNRLSRLHMARNHLGFASIEKNLTGPDTHNFGGFFAYNPQLNTKDSDKPVALVEGALTIENDRAGGNNTNYQWQQWDGAQWVDISGASTLNYTILNADSTYLNNRYRARMTNDWIDGLTIYSSEFVIFSEGVILDSLEWQTLKDLYDSTSGGGWSNNTNWPTDWSSVTSSYEFGQWHGVTVVDGDITAINLQENNLIGELQNSIAVLDKLKALNLSSNGLTGNIPDTLGYINSLNTIYLSNNELYGVLPDGLGNLSNLSTFDVSNNELCCLLPDTLSSLISLSYLNLSGNHFRGEIPIAIMNLPLVHIDLSHNEFIGQIPDEITGMNDLQVLKLGGNDLHGEIPTGLAELPVIEQVDLAGNSFVDIPNFSGLSTAATLSLDISQNLLNFNAIEQHLTGSDVDDLGYYVYAPQKPYNETIEQPIIEGNSFIANDRAGGDLTVYQWQEFISNQWTDIAGANAKDYLLSGLNQYDEGRRFRAKMTNEWAVSDTLYSSDFVLINGLVADAKEQSVLKDIFVALGGPQWTNNTNWPDTTNWPIQVVASEFATWYGINVEGGDIVGIDLNSNNLSGEMPASMGGLIALRELTAFDNLITGSIPGTLGQLLALEDLNLGQNEIVGGLNANLQQLKSIKSIDLSDNIIGDRIPDWLYKLDSLTTLNLKGNQFYGSIPSSVGSLKELTYVNLDSNKISGTVPKSIGGLTNLIELHLKSNQIAGRLPDTLRAMTALRVLDVSGNLLSGSVPDVLSEMGQLEYFRASDNRFYWSLPEFNGANYALKEIVLSNNEIFDTIPSSWINLVNLERLDLSNNHIQADVPDELITLNALGQLHLQNNEIAGLGNYMAHANAAGIELRLDNNHLDFGSIEQNLNAPDTHGYTEFNYKPQKNKIDQYFAQIFSAGTITITNDRAGGNYTHYQWQELVNDIWVNVEGETDADYVINEATFRDSGRRFRCMMTNDWVSGLILYSTDVIIFHFENYDPIADRNVFEGVSQQFNGNIAGVKWKNEVGDEHLYAYYYDDLNRLRKAHFTSKNEDTGDWTKSRGNNNVENVTYDQNGNLASINRYAGIKGAREIDRLNYIYDGNNRLKKVQDDAIYSNGFVGQTGISDDYEYDINGNLIKDRNKGIDTIFYNMLNLPDKIMFDGQRELDSVHYIYDANGILHNEISFKDGAEVANRKYNGGVVYSGDQIVVMGHEEGSLVVDTDSSGNHQFEYRYNIRDHLGNTRAIFEGDQGPTEYMATMESENASLEEQLFEHLSATRMLEQNANVTPDDPPLLDPANEVAALNSTDLNRIVGPSLGLVVEKGDKIDIQAYASYYNNTSGDQSKIASNALVTAVAGVFGGINGGTETQQFFFDLFDNALTVFSTVPTSNPDLPQAYLNYVLFNGDLIPIDMGFIQVPESAQLSDTNLDATLLAFDPINIQENGFIYIYTSNESAIDIEVFFDDMKVTHTKSPLISTDDYYPFGMSISSIAWHREDSNYKGNMTGQGLGLQNLGFRFYDPLLGRFTTTDPLAEVQDDQSTYQYAANNPINNNDVLGLVASANDTTQNRGGKVINRGGARYNGIPSREVVPDSDNSDQNDNEEDSQSQDKSQSKSDRKAERKEKRQKRREERRTQRQQNKQQKQDKRKNRGGSGQSDNTSESSPYSYINYDRGLTPGNGSSSLYPLSNQGMNRSSLGIITASTNNRVLSALLNSRINNRVSSFSNANNSSWVSRVVNSSVVDNSNIAQNNGVSNSTSLGIEGLQNGRNDDIATVIQRDKGSGASIGLTIDLNDPEKRPGANNGNGKVVIPYDGKEYTIKSWSVNAQPFSDEIFITDVNPRTDPDYSQMPPEVQRVIDKARQKLKLELELHEDYPFENKEALQKASDEVLPLVIEYLNQRVEVMNRNQGRLDDRAGLSDQEHDHIVEQIDKFEERGVDANVIVVETKEEYDKLIMEFENGDKQVTRDVQLVMKKGDKENYKYFYKEGMWSMPENRVITNEDGTTEEIEYNGTQEEIEAARDHYMDKAMDNDEIPTDFDGDGNPITKDFNKEPSLGIFERGMWLIKSGTDFLNDIEIGEKYWLRKDLDGNEVKSDVPFKVPNFLSSSGNFVLDEAKSIPQMISFGLSLFDKEERKQVLEAVSEIDLEEIVNSSFEEKKAIYSGEGDQPPYEMIYDGLSLISTIYSFGAKGVKNMVGDVINKLDNVPSQVMKKLDLPSGKKSKLLKDMDTNGNLKSKLDMNPELAKTWDKLDDAGIDETLKSDQNVLEKLHKLDCK